MQDPACYTGIYHSVSKECRLSEAVGQDVINNLLASSQWITFTKQDCGQPPEQPNTSITPGDTTTGSERQYECNNNYVTTPDSDVSSMIVTCESSGLWSLSNFQCLIDCGDPTPITGVVVPTGATYQGSELILQCDTGYQPENAGISSDTIQCKPTGSWDGFDSSFNCLKECDDPPNIADASLSVADPSSRNLEGDTRMYSCNTGYTADAGSDAGVITCSGGTWSTSTLACVVDCGEPPTVTNSYVVSGDTTVGTTRQYVCNTNYATTPDSDVSSMAVMCLSSGSWTSSNFQCVIECDDPPSIANAQLSAATPSGRNLKGDTRMYSCKSGYAAKTGSNNDVITCYSYGWSSSTLTCGLITTVTQWVSLVVGFSSEWTKDAGYEATQVIGAPNVYPSYGDLQGSWSSKDATSNEFITVPATKVQKIHIEADCTHWYEIDAVKLTGTIIV